MNSLGIRADHRTAMIIDGPSLFGTSRALGFDIDYRKLLSLVSADTDLYRAIYVTAILDSDDHNPIVPLSDFLSYNGYRVVTKVVDDTDDHGRRKLKTGVELATEMLEASAFVDHILLFSGDGDLTYVTDAVQRKGVRVTAVSSTREEAASISSALRRQVDNFVEIANLREAIEKPRDPNRAPRFAPTDNVTVVREPRRSVTHLGGVN